MILLGVGLIAQRRHRAGTWSSNNRADAASLFQIGQWMLTAVGLRGSIPAIQRQLASEVSKWG